MKKIILLLFCVNTGFAQLSNGNFESIFTNTTTSETFFPSWTGDYGSDTSSISKSGMYAAKVWTWYNYAPGHMYYGSSINSADKLMGGGLPINSKPTSLNGFYKFDTANVQSKDSAFVFLALKKRNAVTGKRDTIAFCYMRLAPANSYTPFSMNIPYKINNLQPDSIVLIFATDNYYLFSTPQLKNQCINTEVNCAYFYIDDLTLSTPAGLTDLRNHQLNMEVFPNPASDKINIRLNRFITERDEAVFNLYDLKGQKIYDLKSVRGHQIEVNVNTLDNGLYFYSIVLKDQTLTGKCVVSHN